MFKPLLWSGGAISLALAFSSSALAQSITAAPDGTGTIITIDGNTYHIQGGTQAGANLFHSFQAFGLSSGEIANFLSNPSITNILGRVTGGDPSVIDGLIQATPNLYLMNPAGIVFGAGASLNVGGDFVATTADRIAIGNGWFVSSGMNDYASLVGTPNQFAFASETPSAILNFGDLTTEKNVSLLGGTVLNQGKIASTQGNVTIAAVPGERLVKISQPGMLLNLEVPVDAIAAGISPVDLPALLTGSGNPPEVALDPAGVSTGALPLQNGDVVIAGEVSGQQVDLYAAGQVTPTDPALIQGETRVVRFSDTGENPDQAVFIDARADHPTDLLYGTEAGTVSQIIEREEDGISVISEQLAVISESVGELDSVAIVAEGNQGNFWLGSNWIRAENINDYQAQLQTWGTALTESADILLYSCFTALGATGEALVQSIADITGADVAASMNATGSANYGGDWDLESNTGSIAAANPFMTETLADWDGKLAIRTVTSLADSGAFTLRDALTGAGGGFGAGPAAGDTINFALSGTILTSGLGWATENLTIDGTGQTVVIDGSSNISGIFGITAANVSLRNLTLQNGNNIGGVGGAIRHVAGAPGALTLTNVTVSGSSTSLEGGGIFSNTTLILNNSTVVGNRAGNSGGGIYSGGALTLNNSTVVGNDAPSGSGGGIFSAGNATLNNSTVAGNSAAAEGGGVVISGVNNEQLTINNTTVAGNSTGQNGGGIILDGSTVGTIINSTISGNYAQDGGGGISSTGTLTLTNTTVSSNSTPADNGGGIFAGGTLTLNNATIAFNTTGLDGGGLALDAFGIPTAIINNTIIANNVDTSGGNAPDLVGNFATSTVRHSLITNPAGIAGLSLMNGVNGNIIGQDPRLGPLQNNGGSTATHALLPGSPAINAGNNGLVSVSIDQNGNLRIVDFNVDIGAYELQVITTPLPDSCLQLGCTPVTPLPLPDPLVLLDGPPILEPLPEETAIAIDTLEAIEADFTLDYWELVQDYADLIDSTIDVAGVDAEILANLIHRNDLLDFILAAGDTVDLAAFEGFSIGRAIEVQNIFPILQALQTEAGIQPALVYFTFTPRSDAMQAQTVETLLASRDPNSNSIQKGETKQSAIVGAGSPCPTGSGFSCAENPVLEFGEPGLTPNSFAPNSNDTLFSQSNHQDELRLILMTPEDYPEVIPISGVTRGMVMQQVRRFQRGLLNARGDRYLEPAQQLYDWLIRPLEPHIEELGLDHLSIIPDEGLRSLPVAALHSGDRFLVEDYSLGILPSLSLIDWRYEALDEARVLAMGASEFASQPPLPAVPLELELISQNRQSFLNDRFTQDNLDDQTQERQFQILHLATHAQFQPGAADAAFIQLWGKETLQLKSLRNFGLYNAPAVELLILSACETAVGDADAELGFAGAALQAGVKSVLASLWQVSDLGTVALMNEFYAQLGNPEASIKAEALRQAQLSLLYGETDLQTGVIGTTPLPPILVQYADADLTHPYYWSAFTLVGSPW
ncbi:MAG: CHAT domain-containing protein [Spirulinaceae cyanobacterium]